MSDAVQNGSEFLLPELSLEFNGSAMEYFRIWIVNLCLTLLTLGVFSAWAKVRKKRYFYSRTQLDGTPFQYLAQPMTILKGRVIAVVLFLIYYLASNIFNSLLPWVLALGLMLAPWALIRTAAFNARYSAYRNLTFSFRGTYWQSFAVLYAWGMVPLLVIGTALAWWKDEANLAYAGAAYGLFGLLFPYWICRLRRFIVNHYSLGNQSAKLEVSGWQFYKSYSLAGLLLLSLGLLAYITFIIAASLAAPLLELGQEFFIPQWVFFAFAVIAVTFIVSFVYLCSYAFIHARLSNITWNASTIGPLEFRSTLKTWGLTKLYFVNLLAILFSFGLLIPWAVIRSHRYRIDHLQAFLDGDAADFVATDASAVKASGAEVGDFFDIDLSL